jgi:hypothetical protein
MATELSARTTCWQCWLGGHRKSAVSVAAVKTRRLYWVPATEPAAVGDLHDGLGVGVRRTAANHGDDIPGLKHLITAGAGGVGEWDMVAAATLAAPAHCSDRRHQFLVFWHPAILVYASLGRGLALLFRHVGSSTG